MRGVGGFRVFFQGFAEVSGPYLGIGGTSRLRGLCGGFRKFRADVGVYLEVHGTYYPIMTVLLTVLLTI